jgi:hypothetical protein
MKGTRTHTSTPGSLAEVCRSPERWSLVPSPDRRRANSSYSPVHGGRRRTDLVSSTGPLEHSIPARAAKS